MGSEECGRKKLNPSSKYSPYVTLSNQFRAVQAELEAKEIPYELSGSNYLVKEDHITKSELNSMLNGTVNFTSRTFFNQKGEAQNLFKISGVRNDTESIYSKLIA
jgi:arsenate reductase-like glutaredoxin family protein